MEAKNQFHVVFSIKAGALVPAFHCEQAHGSVTVRLGSYELPGTVYLDGTWEEIATFARALAELVPAPECNPVAGVHVDPHTCGLRASDEDDWPELDAYKRAHRECGPDCCVTGDECPTAPSRPACVDCRATMTHDQGPYWFCIDTECPAYMHTILIDGNGSRSHVGVMR